jgi:hypothetical protein
MTDIPDSGSLNSLAKPNRSSIDYPSHGLGTMDESLTTMIFEDLGKRGLAKNIKESVSIPLHPMVRWLVLVRL